MTQHGRVHIVLSRDRMKLLNGGREVYITLNDVKYILTAEVHCCNGMKKLLGQYGGKKLLRSMKFCPFCKAEVLAPGNGEKVSKYKGKSWTKDPITGKRIWKHLEDKANGTTEQGQ